MARKKTYNLIKKIRDALRGIHRYSPMRKEVIKKAKVHRAGVDGFICPECEEFWPIQMADVDHEPPLGALEYLGELGSWTDRLFYGSTQVICKLCHKKKTKYQRKKKAA